MDETIKEQKIFCTVCYGEGTVESATGSFNTFHGPEQTTEKVLCEHCLGEGTEPCAECGCDAVREVREGLIESDNLYFCEDCWQEYKEELIAEGNSL